MRCAEFQTATSIDDYKQCSLPDVIGQSPSQKKNELVSPANSIIPLWVRWNIFPSISPSLSPPTLHFAPFHQREGWSWKTFNSGVTIWSAKLHLGFSNLLWIAQFNDKLDYKFTSDINTSDGRCISCLFNKKEAEQPTPKRESNLHLSGREQ